MNVELRHRFTPDVDVLDLLRGDVLALRQLEDVFFPVDDLQRAVLHQTTKRTELQHLLERLCMMQLHSLVLDLCNVQVTICRCLRCGANRLRPASRPFSPGL